MDMMCLETGLLHDVVEDTTATLEEIRKNFGNEVARCVDGVTKLSKLNLAIARGAAGGERPQDAARHGQGYPRDPGEAGRPAAQHADAGVARSHDRQVRIAQETMEIYAPIAHRLGMGKIRGELEDLAFQYLEPEASAELLKEFEAARAGNEAAAE